jgi:predicted metal-dependent hydrolase
VRRCGKLSPRPRRLASTRHFLASNPQIVWTGHYRVTVTDDRVEIRRSTRRKRTVSAYRDGDRIVVLVPSRLRRADEQRLVAELVERVTQRERLAMAGGARAGDEALMRRCRELARRHLGGPPYPSSVRWVKGMRTRWASCTPVDATIRVSERLRAVPDWVLDYVLVHELAHLQVAGHGPRFWALVERYPRSERARGYLDGLSAGMSKQGLDPPVRLDGADDDGAGDDGAEGVLF